MKKLLKNKKSWILMILALGIFLWIIWIMYSSFPLKSIYLYKTGTDIPIANQHIIINYSEPFCDSYFCSSTRTYEGYTKNDGSFRISLRDALKIQDEVRRRYPPYFIEIDNFDYQPNTIPSDQDNNFLIFLTEVKRADEPLKVALGEEFRLSSDLTNDFTLQLHSIHQKAQTVELKLILNNYYSRGPVIQNFTLEKDVPAYIPREISDSQLILTDIQERQATFNFLPQSSTITWNQRKIDYSAEINMNDQRYLNALAYFKKIEEQYREYSGETVKLAPFKYDNDRVEAIGPVDFDPMWISHGEWPKVGGFCLVSSFHLDTTKEDLAEGRGSSNWIKACLPSERNVSMEKFLNF